LCAPSVWAQEAPLPDVSASADHIDAKGRLCFYPKDLAKALYAFEECKLRLKLESERGEAAEAAIEDMCQVKVNAAQQWCSGQIKLVQSAYSEQVRMVTDHCGNLVEEISKNYGEQVKMAAEMAPQHIKPKFWRTPEFWGPVAAVLGVTAGVFIGIGVSKVK